MKVKLSVLKIIEITLYALCLIAVSLYFQGGRYTWKGNAITAIMVLIFTVIFVVKCHSNKQLFVMSLCILYFNYSVIVNDYLTIGKTFQTFMKYHSVSNYGKAICILAMFFALLLLFYKSKSIEESVSIIKEYRKEYIIPIFILLLLILFYGINRNESAGYTVRITEFYEYSYLLFLFAFRYAGNGKWNKIFQMLLLLFVAQDLYYGGRVTSLQLLILLAVVCYPKMITVKNIIVFGITGVIAFGLIDMYRVSYSFQGISMKRISDYFLSAKGTLNTAYNSYYTSVLHVWGRDLTNGKEQLDNLTGFLANIIGIHVKDYIPLADYLKNMGLRNIGGGWYITYFYFWLGIVGVIAGSVLCVVTFNYVIKTSAKKKVMKLCFVIMVVTVPRWYLYTPLSLFRGIFLTILLYFFFEFADGILLQRGYKK